MKKQGGARECTRRMKLFANAMQCRNLIDIGASGCWFTWSNNHPIASLIKKRLDQVVCNVLWRDIFQEAFLYNLPRLHGDHCPLLLNLDGISTPVRSRCPFRFELA
ncbi:hypothetical protein REPUB_Repub01dG0076700 [Reevesia pubescens]